MPISLNLIAEIQETEEQRRRDPVKRGLWIAGFLVALVLLGMLYLQFQLWIAKEQLAGQQARWSNMQKEYRQVTDNRRRSQELEQKLQALAGLATNRFLWGPVLNAFQFAIIDRVQITRLKGDQTFNLVETRTKVSGNKEPVKILTVTEKLTLTIDAKDVGEPLGERVDRFREAMANYPTFKQYLTNENSVSLKGRQRMIDATDQTKSFVMFTIECVFPDKNR